MGFRCPKCQHDFGTNYVEFTHHLSSSPLCSFTSSAIVSSIHEIFSQIDSTENVH